MVTKTDVCFGQHPKLKESGTPPQQQPHREMAMVERKVGAFDSTPSSRKVVAHTSSVFDSTLSSRKVFPNPSSKLTGK